MSYKIRLWYGPYVAVETVNAEDDEEAIAKAWSLLRKRGLLTLPMAYRSAKILKTEENE
jgi:hypothetical protein